MFDSIYRLAGCTFLCIFFFRSVLEFVQPWARCCFHSKCFHNEILPMTMTIYTFRCLDFNENIFLNYFVLKFNLFIRKHVPIGMFFLLFSVYLFVITSWLWHNFRTFLFQTSITINYFILVSLSNQRKRQQSYIHFEPFMCIWNLFSPLFFRQYFYVQILFSHIFTTENAQWKIKLKIFYATSVCRFID